MAAPEVPPEPQIEVDPETGVWTTDGLAMIYVPRHFFVNYHRAVEQVLGPERHGRVQFEAGHKSAYDWCARQAEVYDMAGEAVVRHYLARLSQRGWGRFSLLGLDAAAGRAQVRLDHSIFCLAEGGDASRPACTLFAGWFAGAVAWLTGGDRSLSATETQCAIDGRADHCRFEVRPAVPGHAASNKA